MDLELICITDSKAKIVYCMLDPNCATSFIICFIFLFPLCILQHAQAPVPWAVRLEKALCSPAR